MIGLLTDARRQHQQYAWPIFVAFESQTQKTQTMKNKSIAEMLDGTSRFVGCRSARNETKRNEIALYHCFGQSGGILRTCNIARISMHNRYTHARNNK
jgi:hypothetical protein